MYVKLMAIDKKQKGKTALAEITVTAKQQNVTIYTETHKHAEGGETDVHMHTDTNTQHPFFLTCTHFHES